MIIKKKYPKVQLVRGNDFQQISQISDAHRVRVNKGSSTPDVLIYSGQIISVVNGSDNKPIWALGVPATSVTNKVQMPYIAMNDSFDFDVMNANSLVGLNCQKAITVGTPFFMDALKGESTNTPYTYAIGTPLTWALPGEVNVRASNGALEPAEGYVRPAKAGETIIGRVTREGPVNLNGGTGDAGFINASVSYAEPANNYVLYFTTALQGAMA